jgi:hypothetical protein
MAAVDSPGQSRHSWLNLDARADTRREMGGGEDGGSEAGPVERLAAPVLPGGTVRQGKAGAEVLSRRGQRFGIRLPHASSNTAAVTGTHGQRPLREHHAEQ